VRCASDGGGGGVEEEDDAAQPLSVVGDDDDDVAATVVASVTMALPTAAHPLGASSNDGSCWRAVLMETVGCSKKGRTA
jgi:hypothetical protein